MNSPASILNVDDYSPGRYARTKVLQHAGFTVWEAASGAEALKLAQERKPSVVLLDVNLPDMSGFEVCRRLRSDLGSFAGAVVHISATNIETDQQVQGLEGGADIYMVEPVDPTLLVATLKSLIRARTAEDALRRSNEELARFGFRVAHDLSEPLRTMAAHTQLIQMKVGPRLDPATMESLNFVVDAATRMRAFIDVLLRYAQVASAEHPFEKVDCEAMLARLIANLETAIAASGVRITHSPMPVIVGDSAIELVFQNLISNAIKYARKDVPPEIRISCADAGGFWVFSVSDNGIGIADKDKGSIFNMFQRLHGRDIPGSGMGLALAKKIVEVSGGSIWVESELGVGSRFFFKVPKEAAAEASR